MRPRETKDEGMQRADTLMFSPSATHQVFTLVCHLDMDVYLLDASLHPFSRKRPRRVPSKKGLSLKIVIKHRPKFY